MKKNLLLSVSIIVFFSACKINYPVAEMKVKPEQLCGKKICDPGNVGFLLHLTESPFSPAVERATSAKDIAIQVLGKTLSADRIRYSKDYNTCSESSKNPFDANDIENIRFADGRLIEYEEKVKLEINVEAATKANVKELAKLTTDAAKIERLEAKIKAAFNKVNGKELIVVGRYSEWELTSKVREQLKKGDGFQSCRKWIEDNNQRIITAIGMVYFDITYEEKSIDDLAMEIDAELAKEGLTASISYAFKKEITKKFKSSNEVYQILIIRHAGIEGKTFIENFEE